MAVNEPESWEVLAHCPKCKTVTRMIFRTDNHERDSSSDRYKCLECEDIFFPAFGDRIVEHFEGDDE